MYYIEFIDNFERIAIFWHIEYSQSWILFIFSLCSVFFNTQHDIVTFSKQHALVRWTPWYCMDLYYSIWRAFFPTINWLYFWCVGLSLIFLYNELMSGMMLNLFLKFVYRFHHVSSFQFYILIFSANCNAYVLHYQEEVVVTAGYLLISKRMFLISHWIWFFAISYNRFLTNYNFPFLSY